MSQNSWVTIVGWNISLQHLLLVASIIHYFCSVSLFENYHLKDSTWFAWQEYTLYRYSRYEKKHLAYIRFTIKVSNRIQLQHGGNPFLFWQREGTQNGTSFIYSFIYCVFWYLKHKLWLKWWNQYYSGPYGRHEIITFECAEAYVHPRVCPHAHTNSYK